MGSTNVKYLFCDKIFLKLNLGRIWKKNGRIENNEKNKKSEKIENVLGFFVCI